MYQVLSAPKVLGNTQFKSVQGNNKNTKKIREYYIRVNSSHISRRDIFANYCIMSKHVKH